MKDLNNLRCTKSNTLIDWLNNQQIKYIDISIEKKFSRVVWGEGFLKGKVKKKLFNRRYPLKLLEINFSSYIFRIRE